MTQQNFNLDVSLYSGNQQQNNNSKEIDSVLEIKGNKNEIIDSKQKKRKSMNVALVIDCSASMQSALNHTIGNVGTNQGIMGQQMGLFNNNMNHQFNNNQGQLWNSNIPNNPYTNPYEQNPYNQPTAPIGLVEQPENKLQRVIEAAKASVQQLNADDNVSIISFSDTVITHLTLTPASNKTQINQSLNAIQTRGYTNLFEGWRQGAISLAEHLDPEKTNRVLLFTDGLANKGEINPDNICSKVSELAQKNISTSTFGVGLDYNEDLLENMAVSGDGHFYYISDNEDFKSMFEMEFMDMSRVLLTNVHIQWGNNVVDCFNDLTHDQNGYKLPNLLNEKNIKIGLKLNQELLDSDATEDLKIKLVGDINGETHVFDYDLVLDANHINEAQEILDYLKLNREKRKAIKALDLGQKSEYKTILRQASDHYCQSQNMMGEKKNIDNLVASVDESSSSARKQAKFESYTSSYSR